MYKGIYIYIYKYISRHDSCIKIALFAGACYDTVNNMLWTCSNDYIDQWCNPGNQAFHYVCQRLGVSHIITEPKGGCAHCPMGRDAPPGNKRQHSSSVSGNVPQAAKCVNSLPSSNLEFKILVI